jgi:hypothetical protein
MPQSRAFAIKFQRNRRSTGLAPIRQGNVQHRSQMIEVWVFQHVMRRVDRRKGDANAFSGRQNVRPCHAGHKRAQLRHVAIPRQNAIAIAGKRRIAGKFRHPKGLAEGRPLGVGYDGQKDLTAIRNIKDIVDRP